MLLLDRIRLFGDPVLRQRATEVTDIDRYVVSMCDGMAVMLRGIPGAIGIAAPQVGSQKRVFVYDVDGSGPSVLINPEIKDSDGEWVCFESCLSLPGVGREIVRPKQVHVVGYDLHGDAVSIESDELTARLFQHEVDHLDGVLLIDHLERSERDAVLREWREIMLREQHLSYVLG